MISAAGVKALVLPRSIVAADVLWVTERDLDLDQPAAAHTSMPARVLSESLRLLLARHINSGPETPVL